MNLEGQIAYPPQLFQIASSFAAYQCYDLGRVTQLSSFGFLVHEMVITPPNLRGAVTLRGGVCIAPSSMPSTFGPILSLSNTRPVDNLAIETQSLTLSQTNSAFRN